MITNMQTRMWPSNLALKCDSAAAVNNVALNMALKRDFAAAATF